MNDEKIAYQIEAELQEYIKLLDEASQTVVNQNVSNYPIFVLSKADIELGVGISSTPTNAGWIIKISTLEEFSARQVIQREKIEGFKSIYKDPSQFFCLFVHDGETARFVFMPNQ